MLVTYANIGQVLADLSSQKFLAIDTETFGLDWHDKLFSIQIAGEKTNYYFNFLDYKDGTFFFDSRKAILQEISDALFKDPTRVWFIHNAKFDMRRFDIEGIEIGGLIWDTAAMERFVRNNYLKYDLNSCLVRRGHGGKDDGVEKYISSNSKICTTKVKVPGKKKSVTLKHYDKVPFAIMYEYGLTDTRGGYLLGMDQYRYFQQNTSLLPLVNNEHYLSRAFFNMERRGVKIDTDYCRRAMVYEEAALEKAYKELEEVAGVPYKSGPKWLAQVLNEHEVEFAVSDKGNPVFDKKSLKKLNHGITNKILAIREHEKKVTSFYSSFLHFAGTEGVIHANYNQGGTDTGRVSCSNPNMQQLPKKDKEGNDNTFTVRQAVIPRENHILVMMDFDAMEYRLVADYAGEHDMIKAIKGGLDPHSYVANMMGLSERDPAKTLNFMKIYGGGLAKLALALFKPLSNEANLKLITKKYIWNSNKIDAKDLIKLSKMHPDVVAHDVEILNKAQVLENQYKKALPKLGPLTEQVSNTAKGRGYIFNRYGRRSYLDDHRFVYAMLNYLIQGTGADVVKHAMVELDQFLADKKSGMIAQVHDEILYEVHKDELDIIPELKRIMESQYKPINGMNLTVGVEWSDKSWAVKDRKKGIPTKEELDGPKP